MWLHNYLNLVSKIITISFIYLWPRNHVCFNFFWCKNKIFDNNCNFVIIEFLAIVKKTTTNYKTIFELVESIWGAIEECWMLGVLIK